MFIFFWMRKRSHDDVSKSSLCCDVYLFPCGLQKQRFGAKTLQADIKCERPKGSGGVPVHKNTVLFQSFSALCRSCHHSSSNIESALRRRPHSPCRCPSCPAPGRGARAWNTLPTSTASERHTQIGRRVSFLIVSRIRLHSVMAWWVDECLHGRRAEI